MICSEIKKLVLYGINCGLLPECESIYAINLLLDLMGEEEYQDTEIEEEDIILEEVLQKLLDAAVRKQIIKDTITDRDLFDTRLMNTLVPRPAQVQTEFFERYKISPREATNYYYKLSLDSDYIRRYRIRRDMKWKTSTRYGEMDITINLSKPEKDPKLIAAYGKKQAGTYPQCQLCAQNEGYAGREDHPARENHRIIPITIQNASWGFQYSPYVYYNEHCIVFNSKHVPMQIDKEIFGKLFDFIKLFPHYFIGSNADLPIVGGSILSHEHFQGGHYDFAMAKAPIKETIQISGYQHVEAGIVDWPMSVIRLRSEEEKELIGLAGMILEQWIGYTDEEAFIYAETNAERHNTITPIARYARDKFELDLVLRNNITTKEHPLGVFHPHAQYHNIKKENIGLIEVMGLAVLPARLKSEMEILCNYLIEGKNVLDIRAHERISKHADWVEKFLPKYSKFDKEHTMDILQKEIGIIFTHVLEDAGVFKATKEGLDAFLRFINTLSITK